MQQLLLIELVLLLQLQLLQLLVLQLFAGAVLAFAATAAATSSAAAAAAAAAGSICVTCVFGHDRQPFDCAGVDRGGSGNFCGRAKSLRAAARGERHEHRH